MRQFASTVKKNVIEKRRNIRVTICECFSHLVMFVILLLGFGLSKIVFFQPENFVKLNVLVPPNIFRYTPPGNPTRNPTPSPTSTSNETASFRPPFVSASNAYAGFKKQLKGPMLIPSFDEYVALSKFIASAAATQPGLIRLASQTSQGMRYGNLLHVGELHFCPYPSAAVDSLVSFLNRTTKSFKTLKSHFHATEADGIDYILNHLENRALALIDLRKITGQKINYVIRQNYTTLPNTNQVFVAIARGLDTSFQMYLTSGFLTLEKTIDKWALDYSVKQVNPAATCISPEVLTVPFPTYEFDSNPFYAQVGFLLGLAMTMSTLYPVSRLVKSVVEEKETRMREVMKIMGLSQTAHQLSWFFTAFIVFFWMSISSTIIAHISFLPHTNVSILFLYFFLFHMSEITLCFLISVFFSNSKLAAIVGPVVLFVAILPKYIFFGSNSNEAATIKYAASLLSPTAFTFGADILAEYEYSAVGIQFSNIADNNFSMVSVLQMMLIDIFIYGFLAWYLDQTIPHEYGTPKHPLFLLNPYYWLPFLKRFPLIKDHGLSRRPHLRSLPSEMNSRQVVVFGTDTPIGSLPYEDSRKSVDFREQELPHELEWALKSGGETQEYLTEMMGPQVHIQNLPQNTFPVASPSTKIRKSSSERSVMLNSNSEQVIQDVNPDIEVLSVDQLENVQVIASRMQKIYPNGKVAVTDFSLAMLEGQITCLLGHNGAGKSSVIAMITGMTTISGGDCTVYDQPLPAALSQIRTMTGICPQQNVLFPSLTVKEHLRFFGCIKGLSGKKLKTDVMQMIHDVGLYAKKDTPASALSGGMKRKLQLAMALIGGSQFLILDEPTSGMDPYSRRATWELLQRHKAGRVIVLTTHFLEEADILGDRIAIMSEGHVRTSGSSLFLKTRFGAGYLLSISISRSGRHSQKTKSSLKKMVDYASDMESGSALASSQEAYSDSLDDSEDVEDVVKSFIPTALVTSQVAGEIIFGLPIQSVPVFASLFNALQQKSALLGIESYGVSLTSLEQVFIKLAKEAETDVDTGHKSIYSRARAAFEQFANSATFPSLNFRRDRKMFTEVNNFNDAKECEMANLYPCKVNEGKGDPENDSSRTTVMDTVSSRADNSVRISAASSIAGGNMKGLNPTSSCYTEFTDASSDKTNGPSVGFPAPSPGKRVSSKVPHDVTGDSKMPAQYDNEPSSPGKSSCWSVDVSLHSCDSNEKHKAHNSCLPTSSAFEDMNDIECMEKEGNNQTYTASKWVQAEELLRKRFITSSRDLKGLFFQVVFPAIQILLILAILTININPAGHTVKMNASIFGFAPNTIIAGRAGFDDFAANMSSSRLILSHYNSNTSEALANTLLQSGNKLFKGAKALAKTLPGSDRRLGAIVFDDKLLVKFDVDYAWIKKNLRFILSNTEVIDFALSSFGVSNDRKKRQSLVIPSSVISGILQPRKKDVPVASTANDRKNLKDFIRSVGDAAKVDTGAVDQLFNSSIFNSFNASGYYDAGSQQSVTISFNSVDSNSQGITLKNLRIKTNNKRIIVGNVELTDAQIRYFLPNHVIEYEIIFPVPVTVMHNSTSAHGIAAFRGEVISAAWQQCYDSLNMTASQRKLSPNVAYVAKNHPLPLTARQSLQNRVLLSLLASLFILVPLCYIPASFITFVVRERMSKAKHLQIVSSVSPYLYWSTTYLWDMGLFLILVLLIIGAFFIYGKKAAEIFISVDEAAGAVFLLLFTYGLSVLPLCYLYSMCFDNHSTAQISIMAINFASGFVAVLAYFVMSTVPETQVAASRIVHVFRFFPPYNIGEGLIAIATAYLENTLLDAKVGYFNFNVAGRNILFMVLEAVGYMSLVLFTESPYYRKAAYWLERQRALLVLKKSVMEATDADGDVIPIDKDEDVLIEEESVAKTTNKGDFALCIENLVKIYPSNFVGGKAKHAVRGLTLGCQSGERFGFLGVNGAGKSSTLNVLTGDIAPTGGEIFIGGMPLSDPKTRESIGYCPQTDPLFDLMTARETLWFYGRIRGIDPIILQRKVEALIRQVGLSPHADRTSGTYSGGNKRKLSLAISLIGSPTVLLLDEPSSGMDPFARRQMWDVIAAVSEKRSVILTTHSMEECEALCTRIGIMVDGRLRCLGPSSHLKARFGNGYQIEVRFSAEDRFEECMELLRSICEDIEIDEKHGQFLRLKVPSLDLGYAFKILEESKMCANGCVLDYTVSQNTLEQVFLKFARMQEQIEGEQDHVDASLLVV